MCFQEQVSIQALFLFKKIAFIKIDQEKGGRRDWLVSSEDSLVTHDKRKTNKRIEIKHRHTDWVELNKQVESPLIVTAKINYTLISTLLSLLV